MRSKKFSFLHSVRVVVALGWSDFSLKYRGSMLGYAWSLVGPLGKFLVIAAVFGPFVRGNIPLYASYLFLGIIIWEHFVTTTAGCIHMPIEKESIIRRLPFPRFLLILSVGYTNLLIFGTHLLIFVVGSMFFTSFSWGVPVVYMVLIVAQMTLLALGVGMILSSFSLKFKDIPHLWNVIVQMLFWLCPVVYRTTGTTPLGEYIGSLRTTQEVYSFGGILRFIAEIQPLSIIMQDARRVLLYASTAGIPSFVHSAWTSCVVVAIFCFGLSVFKRRSQYFLQEY